jgi:hypothetical protein
MKRLICLSACVFFLAAAAWAESPEAVGQVIDGTTLLTASANAGVACGANYLPSSSGIQVSDRESFGLQLKLEESTGADPSVIIYVQGSMDQTNWVTYTQSVIYPATAAATAAWAITAETTYYLASIQPGPVRYLRIYVCEWAADADVTATWYIFQQ